MNIGIVIICTNCYFLLGVRFIKNFTHHYKGSAEITFYVFSDTDPRPYFNINPNIVFFNTSHTCWLEATNSKFKNILLLNDVNSDYLYYFDADTNIKQDFVEQWFLGDVVGGIHFNNNYLKEDGSLQEKPYDRNIKSTSYIPFDTQLEQIYYLGAFFGGKKEKIIELCKQLYENQLINKANNVEPVWNDESYLNHYFHYNNPSYIIPYKRFEFITSDKGGLNTVHNTGPNIDISKQLIIDKPDKLFELVHGLPYFTITMNPPQGILSVKYVKPLLVIHKNKTGFIDNIKKIFRRDIRQ